MIKGIYRIVNLNNSKIYIGSTTNFSRRNKEHFKLLLPFHDYFSDILTTDLNGRSVL